MMTIHNHNTVETKAAYCWKVYCWIFVDLKKAFDTMDHNILISRLDYYKCYRCC